jgi:hypothetical protein
MNERIVVSFLATLLFVSVHFAEAQQAKSSADRSSGAVLSSVWCQPQRRISSGTAGFGLC